MGKFNAEEFMAKGLGGRMDTEVELIPAEEFPATVSKFEITGGEISKGERAGQPWASLRVVWEIDDPALADRLGRKKLYVRQDVFLDLDEDGSLAVGKGQNVQLGKLRDALGLNKDGTSFEDLTGRSGIIRVRHSKGQDDVLRAEVAAVAAA